MKYPIIVDSGANYHMFEEKGFFTTLVPTQGTVILGDGTTTLAIQGIGQVKCTIGDHTLIINDVRYVPSLAESIYSLFLHIKQQNHGVQSSFDEGLHLAFPEFTTKAIVGHNDLYLDAHPHPENRSGVDFPKSASTMIYPSVVITILTTPDVVPTEDNNLLKSLRQYYSDVKTKRQFNLNVPAGFRPSSTHQKDFNIFAPPCKARSAEALPLSDLLDTSTNVNSTSTIDTLSSIDESQPSPSTTSYSIAPVPILRCVDKPATSLPSRLTFTEDFLHASVSFRRIDMIKSHLATLYQNTITLDSSPPDAVLYLGDLSNLR
jgi:hypothetical protein